MKSSPATEAARGSVFDIKRFAVHDGPGIRTTVFIRGCPLRCAWCHNPESRCPAPEAGEETDVETVMREVRRDATYYEKSGGGITLSGGEPTASPEFTLALLRAAREEGLHTCLDTCGYAPAALFRELIGLADLFLYDIKETDDRRHRRWTGVSNAPIIANLREIGRHGGRVVLTCPVVPGVNDRPGHFRAVASLADSMDNIEEIRIAPYHALGEHKRARAGGDERRFTPPAPAPDEEVERWMKLVASHTAVPVGLR